MRLQRQHKSTEQRRVKDHARGEGAVFSSESGLGEAPPPSASATGSVAATRKRRRGRATVLAGLLVGGLVAPAALNPTPASAACVPSGWYVSNEWHAAVRYSPAYWAPGGQEIKFKTGWGRYLYRLNSNCTTSRALRFVADEYAVRNPTWYLPSSYSWSSWSAYNERQASACGNYPVQPGNWACNCKTGKMVAWT